MDAWLGTTYSLELMKFTWDFKHHYSSAHVSILEFFMNWPNLDPAMLLPGDKFIFDETEAVLYEDEYWRFDLLSVLSLFLGSSLKDHPLIKEFYGPHKIIQG